MSKLSTNQVAKKLGLTSASLTRYILAGKVAAPPETMAGGMRMRLWSESDIERLKEALPKIANGRKTRYKKQSALGNQRSVKTKKKTQARAPALHKKNRNKKKR
jgi:predicted DNA-binding transcriptional regulator AlpA